MAYEFENQPFRWTKTGQGPTPEEIQLGLQGGMALPADFVNKQWTDTCKAIYEIQNAIENGEAFKGASLGGNNVTVDNAVAIGNNNTITNGGQGIGDGAFVVGYDSNVAGDNAAAIGYGLQAYRLNSVVGKYNKIPDYAVPTETRGDLFIVGNGTSEIELSNAFRVSAAGQCYGTTYFASSGADYAEFFEWLDGNPDSEDRRGLFVTLDGEKIRLATADDDYILGAISAAPTVIGDTASEEWHGKYEKDVFGERVLENGSYKLSEAFDSEQDINYANRFERPEWGIVGLTGKLVVVDDGTCQVNGYCYPSVGGIATASDKGYRVMSRIDKAHIRVMIK